jgi:hypothetical protein
VHGVILIVHDKPNGSPEEAVKNTYASVGITAPDFAGKI